ncbi:hypothetical protein ACE01N_17570 [Saccharicrinis sp. FJH2]|uniref:hypothetical protein n=1 Tax=Saccharicrinis sp. FJH65 TaxID=3344659 RepID=UPI0035F4C688
MSKFRHSALVRPVYDQGTLFIEPAGNLDAKNRRMTIRKIKHLSSINSTSSGLICADANGNAVIVFSGENFCWFCDNIISDPKANPNRFINRQVIFISDDTSSRIFANI